MKIKLFVVLFVMSAAFLTGGANAKIYAAETQTEISDNEVIDSELMLDYKQNSVVQTKLIIVLVMGLGILIGAICIYMFLSRLK